MYRAVSGDIKAMEGGREAKSRVLWVRGMIQAGGGVLPWQRQIYNSFSFGSERPVLYSS